MPHWRVRCRITSRRRLRLISIHAPSNSSANCRKRKPGNFSASSCGVRLPKAPLTSSRHRRMPVPVQSAKHEMLQPPGWPQPKGYANGIKARGEFVFVGGMVGWDAQEKFPSGFVAQAKQALENIVAVLTEGGARPEHIVRMTWYVLDMDEYLACRRELGAAYRAVLGDHFPAMALVQVGRLFEPEARLEIETTAVVP